MKHFKFSCILFLGLTVAAVLLACSSENAFSKAEGDLDDMNEAADDEYYSSASHSYEDEYYYSRSSSSYRYSSSSIYETSDNDEAESFLYKDFSVEIDLTWFRQLSDNWEEQNSHEGDYSDGDPGISFVIKTYADYDLKDSVKTDVFKLEDAGTWNGHEYFTKEFNAGVNKVYICPIVIERNVFFANVDHSSYYCYYIRDVGKNVGTSIDQSDSEATDYQLEWTVLITYN